MTKTFARFLVCAAVGSCLIPTVTEVAAHRYNSPALFIDRIGLGLAIGLAVLLVAMHAIRKIEPAIDADAAEQAKFLDAMPARYVDFGIAGAAAISLFLELAVIRWQGSVFAFFAFYTNFGLLACFAGLGLGYALAARDRIPLAAVIPLLVWQFALLIGFRSNLPPWQLEVLGSIPVVEQGSMGLHSARTVAQGFAIYFFLATVFLLTALAFIPIGQVCGRLMSRRPHLRAYGLNLAGSLAGVVLMFGASSLWTPPAIWYALSFGAILALSVWRAKTLVAGGIAAMVALSVLSWPVQPEWRRIYSPYQMLELGYSERGTMVIRAAGHYYQRVHDFSTPPALDDSAARRIRDYYDLPYRFGATPHDVVVVGAGAGNDVAAALRAGVDRVDAVEIDPAILSVGGANHPEHPYDNRRAHVVLADARSFLRTTDRTYDLVVYGLLDSHTLLSQASSLRLDSYVYTVEGFREARARLRPGGRICLSFAILSTELGEKMQEMMREAFDGADPVVIAAGYDGAVTFMQSKEGNLAVSPSALAGTGFTITTRYATRAEGVQASTDDWPFFYMARRIYPVSYLALLAVVLLVTVAMNRTFITERTGGGEATFFLLGAGFMLVETKAITELGLMFASTWRVTGVVIAGILLMAFLANVLVERFHVQRPHAAFALLVSTLTAGWLVIGRGGLPSTMVGRWAMVALVTSPMLFSGVVFSTLLRGRRSIAAVMSANLLGAMCGGILEYNSMYFGFRFLYLVAIAFYAGGFVAWTAGKGRAPSRTPMTTPAQTVS